MYIAIINNAQIKMTSTTQCQSIAKVSCVRIASLVVHHKLHTKVQAVLSSSLLSYANFLAIRSQLAPTS